MGSYFVFQGIIVLFLHDILFSDLGEAVIWPVFFPRPGTRAT